MEDLTARYEDWYERQEHALPDKLIDLEILLMKAFRNGYEQGRLDVCKKLGNMTKDPFINL